jgi:tRNA pseudouridine55 synthase
MVINQIDASTKFEDGVVITIDKPYKWTSFDVIRKIQSLLRYKLGYKKIKVGHAGTLDPLATGLLIVCIGKATKQIESLQAEEKEYVANVRFGATTPCFDLEKPIDAEFPFEHINADAINAVIPSFTGDIDQVPPLFSAKMVDGVRAYELAREGSDMELKPNRITINELTLLRYDAPVADFLVRCSKGTYIRSLARDLGQALDSGAHLVGLRRTASGSFRADDAYSMEKIENIFEELKQSKI